MILPITLPFSEPARHMPVTLLVDADLDARLSYADCGINNTTNKFPLSPTFFDSLAADELQMRLTPFFYRFYDAELRCQINEAYHTNCVLRDILCVIDADCIHNILKYATIFFSI